MTTDEPRTGWDDLGKLLIRLTVGALLLFHGIAKVKTGPGFIANSLSEHGMPGFFAYGVYVGEVVAPILLILGLITRPAALVVAFNMVVAILLVQRAKFFTINERGGAWGVELEMFFMVAAIAIFFLGSGRFALSRGNGRWD